MPKKRLGEVLLEGGFITDLELSMALQLQQDKGTSRLGEVLLEMGAIDEERLAWALAEHVGAPCLNLNNIFIDPKTLQRFPKERCQILRALPIGIMEDCLTVAMTDPFDVVAHDELRALAGMPIRIAVATRSSIARAIEKYFSDEVALDEMVSRILPTHGIEVWSDEELERDDQLPASMPLEEYRREGDSRPVIRLVNSVIRDALKMRASDIHIEPMETSCLVRYRIDGIMRNIVSIPMFLHPRTVCRIKIMARMDIAEHRQPQDGHARVRYNQNCVDLRISTLPTQHGEKVVMRVLNPQNAQIRLENMGLLPDALRRIEQMLRFPHGIILLTGPTGSGKTTTLYAMLQRLKAENFNIITLENPVEYDLPGIIQTQVNEKAGMTFASGFRSILRQDPDVVMVGEIRDQETADVALNAAMTGHLVLSTLHTNDACSVPVRLRELGASAYLITSALKGVISQRLVRRLCTQCREQYTPDHETCKLLGLNPREPVLLHRPRGCKTCNGTGYLGRVGTFEILVLSEAIKEKIFSGNFTSAQLAEQAARDGMRDLMEDAALEVIQGVTSLDEVMRVVPIEERKGLCPQCQRRVERYFRICPYCSFQLWKNICHVCGKELEEGWNFCPYCAQEPRIEPEDGPAYMPSQDLPRDIRGTPADFAVTNEAPLPRCDSCGMVLKANWEECPLCLKPRSPERADPLETFSAPSGALSRKGMDEGGGVTVEPVSPLTTSGIAGSEAVRLEAVTIPNLMDMTSTRTDPTRRLPLIMIVTEDPAVLMEVRRLAAEVGFRATQASSISDACRRLEARNVAAVVAARLTQSDGVVLCKKLRDCNPEIPIALMVSDQENGRIQSCLEGLGITVVGAPIKRAELETLLPLSGTLN